MERPIHNRLTYTQSNRAIIEKNMPLPEIHKVELLAQTRFFKIESMDLEFSNGVTRVYERLPAVGTEGVIVVAVNDDDELLLIREYCAGFHEIQLTLPKGSAEPGETIEEASNREIAEEIGHAARDIQFVKRLTLAPGHMGYTINVMCARGLYPHRLPADEPELPEVVRWPLAEMDALINSEDFNEARAIAALILCRPLLTNPW
jgi:ADP-ribose diphosphatase